MIPIKKEPLESNEELEFVMSPNDIDNEVDHLLSQEVRNLYSGLHIRTFQVLDYFDPTYRYTTQSIDWQINPKSGDMRFFWFKAINYIPYLFRPNLTLV